MRYFIQILLLFNFHIGLGQGRENIELLVLSPFNLGDSMNKFQGSIICTDGNKNRPCEMYHYLPNIETPKIIAGVSFDQVKVFIGKKQVVKNIYLVKNYKGVDSIALNAESENDFRSVVNYFKHYFSGIKFRSGKDKLDSITWETYSLKMNNFTFSVQKENFKKREDNYTFSICIMVMGK